MWDGLIYIYENVINYSTNLKVPLCLVWNGIFLSNLNFYWNSIHLSARNHRTSGLSQSGRDIYSAETIYLVIMTCTALSTSVVLQGRLEVKRDFLKSLILSSVRCVARGGYSLLVDRSTRSTRDLASNWSSGTRLLIINNLRIPHCQLNIHPLIACFQSHFKCDNTVWLFDCSIAQTYW